MAVALAVMLAPLFLENDDLGINQDRRMAWDMAGIIVVRIRDQQAAR